MPCVSTLHCQTLGARAASPEDPTARVPPVALVPTALLRMACSRAVVAAVHLRVVFAGFTDRRVTATVVAKIDTVLRLWHKRATRSVYFVIAVRLSVLVDVVFRHLITFQIHKYGSIYGPHLTSPSCAFTAGRPAVRAAPRRPFQVLCGSARRNLRSGRCSLDPQDLWA